MSLDRALVRPLVSPLVGPLVGFGGAWTPAQLFAGGQDGCWYDPSDTSTLWEDDAGTTPASVNGVVGRVDDKSGNGNHATQSTAAAKPILRQSGSLYYLEFDNVDDYLEIGGYRPTPSTVCCFSLGLTTTDTLGLFFTKDGGFSSYFYIFQSGGSSTTIAVQATIDGVWKDGSAATPIATRGNLYTHALGANSLSGKVTIGAFWDDTAFRFSGGGGTAASGNYYGIVISTDDWTADERTEVDAYMRAKKGL